MSEETENIQTINIPDNINQLTNSLEQLNLIANNIKTLEITILIFDISIAILSGIIAYKKGYNGLLWFLYCFSTSIFGFFQVILLTKYITPEEKQKKNEKITGLTMIFSIIEIISLCYYM